MPALLNRPKKFDISLERLQALATHKPKVAKEPKVSDEQANAALHFAGHHATDLVRVGRQIMTREALKERVLGEVNMLRTEYGYEAIHELPPGIRKDYYNCPLSRALRPMRVSVSAAVIIPGPLSPGRSCPPAMQTFISIFDRGGFPELVEH